LIADEIEGWTLPTATRQAKQASLFVPVLELFPTLLDVKAGSSGFMSVIPKFKEGGLKK